MRQSSSYTCLDGVEVIRESGSGKAFLCRWQDTEQWVPKSQLHPDHLQPGMEVVPGETADLHVKEFIADRWFDERPEEASVSFQGAEVIRETEKGLQVRLSNGRTEWLPRWAVPDSSPVRGVTDPAGELKVLERIARDKGLVQDVSAPAPPTAGDSARQADFFDGPGFDGDDDIPF